MTYFDQSGDTQAEFAERISRSQSYISRVVNGGLEPSLADALIIAREAGVPLESLIKRPQAVSGT
jgi:transcriptional regulator with XRE-family HTH domain